MRECVYFCVLYLEWFFFPGALFPSADEGLFVSGDVVVVDMLNELVLSVELESTFAPMAVGLGELGFPFPLSVTVITCLGFERKGRHTCRRR